MDSFLNSISLGSHLPSARTVVKFSCSQSDRPFLSYFVFAFTFLTDIYFRPTNLVIRVRQRPEVLLHSPAQTHAHGHTVSNWRPSDTCWMGKTDIIIRLIFNQMSHHSPYISGCFIPAQSSNVYLWKRSDRPVLDSYE